MNLSGTFIERIRQIEVYLSGKLFRPNPTMRHPINRFDQNSWWPDRVRALLEEEIARAEITGELTPVEAGEWRRAADSECLRQEREAVGRYDALREQWR